MKGNPDKCHIITNSISECHVDVESSLIQNSSSERLLGVVFDNLLKFDIHIKSLCTRASVKLQALSRILPFMNLPKRRLLANSFFMSMFSYCPLIWMFHSRRLNRKINSLHERCLRVVYDDSISTFQELLLRDGAVRIHDRNLQFLAIEFYKIKNNISPLSSQELFPIKENINSLRHQSDFVIRPIKTVYNGEGSLSYLGPKIWALIPDYIKMVKSLNIFKQKIKTWVPSKCPCRICRTHIEGVGFID